MSVFDNVVLVNKGKKLESKWDGKPFVLKQNQKKEVVRGLAEHFINKYPKHKLEIEDVEEEEPEEREVEQNEEEQEEAFGELEGEGE